MPHRPDAPSPEADALRRRCAVQAFLPRFALGDDARDASKIGGTPWLSGPWPACPTCTQPLRFVLQLRRSELPESCRWALRSELLQLFLCDTVGKPGTPRWLCQADGRGWEPFAPSTLVGQIECEGAAVEVGFALTRDRRRTMVSFEHAAQDAYGQMCGDALLPALAESQVAARAAQLLQVPRSDEAFFTTSPWMYPPKRIAGWDELMDVPAYGDISLDEVDLLESELGQRCMHVEKLAGAPAWVQDPSVPTCRQCGVPMRAARPRGLRTLAIDQILMFEVVPVPCASTIARVDPSHVNPRTLLGRYSKSQALLSRAKLLIPGGTQTLSKASHQYPTDAAPCFIERGLGSHVWDVDGNEYVDFVNGLGTIVLGHGDPEVDGAVRAQLTKGVSHSLPTTLEMELAELLCSTIPCAEQVSFGKNGSDVTAAAVRLARAVTGRQHVAACGYHGWLDWCLSPAVAGTGIDVSASSQVHRFAYNDLSALQSLLDAHPGQFAAIMLEPLKNDLPAPGFLQGVRDAATKAGAVLVFDEMVTGFRVHAGGAQRWAGVAPDLGCFGKAMSNGFPLAALVGRRAIMADLERVFFSTTSSGEALSLAAAVATVSKIVREDAPATLERMGQRIREDLEETIRRHHLAFHMRVMGHPCWLTLGFSAGCGATREELRALYLQEMLARGILTQGTFMVCWAHTDEDLARLSRAHEETCALIETALESGGVASALVAPPVTAMMGPLQEGAP